MVINEIMCSKPRGEPTVGRAHKAPGDRRGTAKATHPFVVPVLANPLAAIATHLPLQPP